MSVISRGKGLRRGVSSSSTIPTVRNFFLSSPHNISYCRVQPSTIIKFRSTSLSWAETDDVYDVMCRRVDIVCGTIEIIHIVSHRNSSEGSLSSLSLCVRTLINFKYSCTHKSTLSSIAAKVVVVAGLFAGQVWTRHSHRDFSHTQNTTRFSHSFIYFSYTSLPLSFFTLPIIIIAGCRSRSLAKHSQTINGHSTHMICLSRLSQWVRVDERKRERKNCRQFQLIKLYFWGSSAVRCCSWMSCRCVWWGKGMWARERETHRKRNKA